ncbi:MAG: spore coat protein CotJB [Bacillota bacterium]|nr:spore coat protein CotJB [Bacillota bacterium]
MSDDRKELLRRLMVAEFAAIDLNLYLDTHPRDERALEAYAKANHEVMMARHEYEEKYGPLVNFGHSHSIGKDARTWRWLNEPWPWEVTS